MIPHRDIHNQGITWLTWTHPTKSGSLRCYLPLMNISMQKNLRSKISIDSLIFDIWWWKNPAIWLVENILGHNWRARFFSDEWFLQNYKKSTLIVSILGKSKKPYLGGGFGLFPQNKNFSEIFSFVSFLTLKIL